MPTYDPKKPPGKYPMVFANVMLQARDGAYGQKFRHFYRTFPSDFRRLAVAQMLSGFKASLRRHPAHPLSAVVDDIQTKVEWEGNDCYITAWKYFRPVKILRGE